MSLTKKLINLILLDSLQEKGSFDDSIGFIPKCIIKIKLLSKHEGYVWSWNIMIYIVYRNTITQYDVLFAVFLLFIFRSG